MAILNWRHHTVIQSLMARGPLNEAEFLKIFSSVTGKNPSSYKKELNDFLLKINKELSYVQMELRCCRNQNESGAVFYGVVNTVSDDQSKLGTKYSVPQIALFKGVEAIMQDATAKGSIYTVDALNIRLENQVQIETGSQSQDGPSQVPPAIRNFSMSQKERTLDELVQDGWLCHTPDGDIGLGARSYLELRGWFHSFGIPSCEVCNEAGVKAKFCENEDCTVRIHHYCLQKKMSQSRGEILCPSCGIKWPGAIAETEVVEEEDEVNEPSESQPPTGSKRKRLRTGKKNNEDATNCGSSQNSQSVPELRRITRASALRR